MNNDYRSTSFKNLLKKLQQESWQLELLISGFAVYALIMAYEPIAQNFISSAQNEVIIYTVLWGGIYTSWGILLLSLVLHVILRGLWIGAIGLRYVSGDIDYKYLNYSQKFTTYLRNKVGTFDRYISRLENYCSIVFALSFLLIFYVLSFFLAAGYLTGSIYLINGIGLPENIVLILEVIVTTIIVTGALLTLIDFIGLGFLKKRKWTSKVYFPFYKLFSFITLSFLYRPLVYNFLDNKFGRRLILSLVPAYLVISLFTSLEYTSSNYIFKGDESSESYSSIKNYEDLMSDDNKILTNFVSIPSKVIETSYLKIFMVYSNQIEDYVFEHSPDLKPDTDRRGIGFGRAENSNGFIKISLNDNIENEKDFSKKEQQYLTTVSRLYKLKIDTLNYKSNFVVSQNKKQRLGFETYLNIKNLPEGKHLLKIIGPTKINGETKETVLATVPFWYFK